MEMKMAVRSTYVWTDAGGRTATMLLTTSGSGATTAAAIAAKSNAAIIQAWGGTLYVAPSPAPTAGTYRDVADVATLFFRTAAGDVVKVAILAPLASIFLADGETVDSTQIAAIISAVLTNVVTSGGAAVTQYVGGLRNNKAP
jgi:hypothetical protein